MRILVYILSSRNQAPTWLNPSFREQRNYISSIEDHSAATNAETLIERTKASNEVRMINMQVAVSQKGRSGCKDRIRDRARITATHCRFNKDSQ